MQLSKAALWATVSLRVGCSLQSEMRALGFLTLVATVAFAIGDLEDVEKVSILTFWKSKLCQRFFSLRHISPPPELTPLLRIVSSARRSQPTPARTRRQIVPHCNDSVRGQPTRPR